MEEEFSEGRRRVKKLRVKTFPLNLLQNKKKNPEKIDFFESEAKR